jgi:hypothetical protein
MHILELLVGMDVIFVDLIVDVGDIHTIHDIVITEKFLSFED